MAIDHPITLTCLIHVCKDESSEISEFNPTSKEICFCCANIWLSSDGIEKRVSENVIVNIDNLEHYGFHRKCYQRFTDTQRISRAEKRILKNGPR